MAEAKTKATQAPVLEQLIAGAVAELKHRHGA